MFLSEISDNTGKPANMCQAQNEKNEDISRGIKKGIRNKPVSMGCSQNRLEEDFWISQVALAAWASVASKYAFTVT